MATVYLDILFVATLFVNAISYLVVIPLYLALFCLGLQLVWLSMKKKAISEENKQLKGELYAERKKHEQLRNAHSLMRLLRDLQHEFTALELLELALDDLLKEVNTSMHPWTWMGDQLLLEHVKVQAELKELINHNQTIKALTRGFDRAELILRKSQTCDLTAEDKEILRTEFVFIYETYCRKAIAGLHLLKTPLPNSAIVPYDLLECTHTIELLENYFSCFLE